MTSVTISVLVPCYNQRELVEEAVESALDQRLPSGWPPHQVVVTDDGSTDDSLERLRRIAARDGRLTIVTAPDGRNTGISGNLTRGLAACRGELVAHLDGDDVMCPDRLHRQAETLLRRTDAAQCMGDVDVFDSATGRTLYRWSTRHALSEGGVELELFTERLGAYLPAGAAKWLPRRLAPRALPSACMTRRAAFPPHGWDRRLRWANDWLVGIEILRHGKRCVIPDVVTRYRRHAANISTTSADAGVASFEEMLIVLAIVEARYPELGPRAAEVRHTLLFRSALHGWDDPALREARWRHAATRGLWPSALLGLAKLRRMARR